MFVFGLIIGPVLGLLAVHLLFRSGTMDARVGALVLALVLVFVLFAGFLGLELKLGLIAGVLLGVLLAFTPSVLVSQEEVQ